MAGSWWFVISLAAAGGELSGAVARALWEKCSRGGRLRHHLQRLGEAGRIHFDGDGPLDERILRLTDEGRRWTQGGVDPLARWARRWDRHWRIVAFDIPESSTALRTRLRRRLHEHRFGWLQNSVWISPDPIDDFRARLNEKKIVPDSLMFLQATTIGGESSEAMVLAAWDFDALAKGYAAYLDILRLRPGVGHGLAAWFEWLATESRAWRQIVRRDPFLPEVLLPQGYRGVEAWAARKEALAGFTAVLARSGLM